VYALEESEERAIEALRGAELPPPAREFGRGSDSRSKRGAQVPAGAPQRVGHGPINREHAVSSGVEPVTDVEEARGSREVLEAVDAGDTDRVLRLVGRI
jgi:hypothetical protein